MDRTDDVKQLVRYLYTDQNILKYVAGIHSKNKSTIIHTNLDICQKEFVENAVKDYDQLTNIFSALALSKENGCPPLPSIYVIAVIAKHLPKESKFVNLRKDFYKLIPVILNSSEKLLIFHKLCDNIGIKKGTIWQNCMTSWYTNREFEMLIDDLLIVNRVQGWTHKDIIKLLHLKTENKVFDVFCKYALYGTYETPCLESPPDADNKIKLILKLKKSSDFKEVEAIVKKNGFIKLCHIPSTLLHHKTNSYGIWKLVLKRMPASDVLNSINVLISTGILNKKEEKKSAVSSLETEIARILSKTTASPILAYITYCNYKKKFGENILKEENLANVSKPLNTAPEVQEVTNKDEKKNKSVDAKLDEVLLCLAERSLNTKKVTLNVQCLITLDLKLYMFKSTKGNKTNDDSKNVPAKCFFNKNVTPGHAGIMLALYLSKLLRHTTIAIFTNTGVKNISFTNEAGKILSLKEIEEKFKDIKTGVIGLDKPFQWAMSHKKSFDCFINIIDTPRRLKKVDKDLRSASSDVENALLKYEQFMKLHNVKSVTVSLSSQKANTNSNKILDICGFDEHVPHVIKNFIQGSFT